MRSEARMRVNLRKREGSERRRVASILALSLSALLMLLVLLVGMGSNRAHSVTVTEFDPWVDAARYQIEYAADLSALPPGTMRRVWIPLPRESDAQRVLSTQIESPWPHRITEDSFGNRIIYVEVGDGTPEAAEVRTRFVVERRPWRGAAAAAAKPGTALDPGRYLKGQRRIPLEGLIADLARQQSDGLESDEAKIRAFYDYVVRNMRYAKHGEGWGQGDAIWACTEKYGNCTDFHSLFIGMARSQGIPARFVIGFPIPHTLSEAEVPGYHCWAEVYDEEKGWFPFDASEAKKSGLIEKYFGMLPSDRVEFSIGRDLILEPAQQGEPINYFIYPYAEVDGKAIPKLPVKLYFKRLAIQTAMR